MNGFRWEFEGIKERELLAEASKAIRAVLMRRRRLKPTLLKGEIAQDEDGVVVATLSSKSPAPRKPPGRKQHAGGQRYKNPVSLTGMLGLEMGLGMAWVLRFLR